MKRIIGLDYGHCEIAAATPVYDGGKFVRIDNLYLDGEKNFVIPAEIEHQGELFNYFKASPGHFDEDVQGNEVTAKRRELMSAKLAAIIKNIWDYNTAINKDDQILLIVGCPTSEEWTSEENRKEYEDLIREATGVEEVRVVPESRAAMFSALSDGKGRMISAAEGAVVYDFGSSTADCTYMKTGERCLEFSWKLGAREVERELRKLMCREASERAFQKGLELMPVENYAKLERLLRSAKEAYFSGSLEEDTSLIAYRFTTDQGKKLPVNLDIDDTSMEEALENEIGLEAEGEIISGGWKDCCAEFFKRSKKYIEENNRSVKEIVLTGGASRMGFVEQYAREVFPEESYTVTCAKNPSFSVSQGLVWVGLVDELEEEVVSIVTKNVKGSEAARISKLKDSIKSNVGNKIYEAVRISMADWAASPKDESLNDLEGRMTREVDKKLNNIKVTNRRCVESWSNGIILGIRSQLEEEVQNSFGPALGQKMKMAESGWKSVSQSLNGINIDVNSIISGIDMNGILKNMIMWAVIVVYTTIGTAVLPGIGSIAGFLVGVVLAAMISDEDREKARKSGIRTKAKKEMEKEKRKKDVTKMCDEQIDKAIDSQITAASVERDIEAIARRTYEIMTLKFEI